MATPSDIGNAAVHGHVAALVTHPGYYYLYALYADYPINNAWFRREEYAALLAERLRVIQPLLALVQPYRKSPALRMFTERRSRERFPPERANEAWRELRELIERVGPPAGWPATPPPDAPDYMRTIPAGLRKRRAASRPSAATPTAPRSSAPARKGRKAVRPRSPIDYSRDV